MEQGNIFTRKNKQGKYVFGRVLLDLGFCFLNKIMDPATSTLSFFQGALLIEIFDFVSSTKNHDLNSCQPVVKGILMTTPLLDSRISGPHGPQQIKWEVVGNKLVSEEDIDFPEYIANWNGIYYLYKGEVKIMLPITHKANALISCRGTAFSPSSFTNLASFHNGITDGKSGLWNESISLKKNDLRYRKQAIRKALWDKTKENYKLDYASLAYKFGFPVSRLIKG